MQEELISHPITTRYSSLSNGKLWRIQNCDHPVEAHLADDKLSRKIAIIIETLNFTTKKLFEIGRM